MRAGKHVYVQKPLTRTVFEAHLLRKVAKEKGVCTQMGNQGTAANGLRRAVEFIRSGGIGVVKEAHVWTNRPIWPQAPEIKERPPEKETPKHVNWDAFIGPAPMRPYAEFKGRPAYHPFAWRGWWDFGTGAIGDMACHTANMAFMALKLGSPLHVAAEAGDVNPETCPSFAHATFKYPARGDMPPVTLHWYEGKKDGKNVLPSPELVPGQKKRDKGFAIYFDETDHKWKFHNPNARDAKRQTIVVASGSFLIGDKAVLFSPDDYGADSYIVTPDGVERLTGDPEQLPRNNAGDLGQKKEWVEAIQAGKPEKALSNFDYASMLTAAFLLGNVAIRAGKPFTFDGEKVAATDCPEAAPYIHYEYRKGWDLLGDKA
jgi:predicted dehydrogenase